MVQLDVRGADGIQGTEGLAARVLVVDDDAALRRTLRGVLAASGTELQEAATADAACLLLQSFRPTLLLLDVNLAEGSAFDVLAGLCEAAPCPAVIAMSGVATPVDAFRLAQLGVRSYLSKPFGTAQLQEAIEQATRSAADIRPHLKNVVGRRGVHEVEQEVRSTMLSEALARSGGNRRQAARLLHVSRQLLQHMLRRGPR